MNKEDMVPEQKYRVTFHDCCVEGDFTAIFKGWLLEAPGDELSYGRAIFDIGNIGLGWGRWEVEEVPSSLFADAMSGQWEVLIADLEGGK